MPPDRPELNSIHSPTPEILQAIFEMSLTGASEHAIARVSMRATPDKWQELKEEFPEIQMSLEDGWFYGEIAAAATIARCMSSEEIRVAAPSAQFYLRQRKGYNQSGVEADDGLRLPSLSDGELTAALETLSKTAILKQDSTEE